MIFKKLNLKTETEIVVINAPDSFEPEITLLEGVTVVRDATAALQITFALAFVQTEAEIAQISAALTAKAAEDALLWFAYPKKSSKKYTAAINRDTGWAALGAAGYEPVRQVAIDADWSALRFRHIRFIKSFKRNKKMILSAEGKERAANTR